VPKKRRKPKKRLARRPTRQRRAKQPKPVLDSPSAPSPTKPADPHTDEDDGEQPEEGGEEPEEEQQEDGREEQDVEGGYNLDRRVADGIVPTDSQEAESQDEHRQTAHVAGVVVEAASREGDPELADIPRSGAERRLAKQLSRSNAEAERKLAEKLSRLRLRAGPMALQDGSTITDLTVGKALLRRGLRVDVDALKLACLIFDLPAALKNFSDLLHGLNKRCNKASKKSVQSITLLNSIIDTPELEFSSDDNDLLSPESYKQIRKSLQHVRDLIDSKHLDHVQYAHSSYSIFQLHDRLTKKHRARIDARKARQAPGDGDKATAPARAYATLVAMDLPGQRPVVEGLKQMLGYGKLVHSAIKLLGNDVLYIWPSRFSSKRWDVPIFWLLGFSLTAWVIYRAGQTFRDTFTAAVEFLQNQQVKFPREDINDKIMQSLEDVRKGKLQNALNDFDPWKDLLLQRLSFPCTPGQLNVPRISGARLGMKRGLQDAVTENKRRRICR
jgi:hypothetical protein